MIFFSWLELQNTNLSALLIPRREQMARFDVAQALSISQLRKRHAEVLVETRKTFDLVGSAIARHATAKCREWQVLGDLREHQFAQIHPDRLRESSSQGRKSTARV